MKDEDKRKEHLIQELGELRQQAAELEASEMKLKQMWEELEAENSKVDFIINSIGSGIDIVSYDYRIQYQNKFLRERFGDIRGKLCYEKYMNRDKPCSDCPMRRAIENNSVELTELIGADGRNYEVHSTPIQNPDGTISAVEVVMDITERKQVEEALRTSERRFRQLAESIWEVFWMTDLERTQMIYASPAYEVIWGRTCKSLYEKPRSFLDAIHSEDRERIIATFEKQAQGDPTEVEYRIMRPDGSVRWIRSRGFPVRNDLGEIYRVAGVAEDITDRKRVEDALQKSEERFRDLADLLPEAVYEIDLDGNLTYANQRAFQLSGYSQEDLKRGLNALQMFIPEDRGRVKKNISRILAGEDLGFMEYTAQRKDGSTFPVVIHSAPIIHDRKVGGLRGIIIDISALKETERKVRTLSSAVEQSIDGIAIGDLKPKLVYVNEAFARMHGYSPEEMLGMKVVNLYDAKQMDQYKKGIKQVKTQGSWIGEIDHIRKDGTSFPTYMTVTLLRDEKGKPTGNVGVCRDITDLKEADKVLRKREKELEIKTNSLEEVNTALRVLLKRRDEDKTELEEKVLVNMRELVVPFLEKLKKTPLDPQQVAYLNVLETNFNAIVSPFLRTLHAKYVNLTPTEIQVANLIKEGKNTKEIGEVMMVSPRTIETHRKKIRKKLGMGKKGGNLRSHLLSLQ